MAGKDMRINEEICVREVRLIDKNGEQTGIVSLGKALNMAKEHELDLVEVSPQARPPVCKLLNYGKYKYDLEKKSKEQRKKASQARLKEVRMQPMIEEHDIVIKTKRVQEFLDQGSKVKVTIRFRGRELAHTEFGKVKLDRVMEILAEDSFRLDSSPRMEGRFMSMLLSPKAKKSAGGRN